MANISGGVYDTDWYQTDWVWAPRAEVHIATRKEWYTNFSDFKSKVSSDWGDAKRSFAVLGLGDVELELTNINEGGDTQYNKVVLKDVLYVPGFPANIFGGCRQYGDHSYEAKRGETSQDNHPSKLPMIFELPDSKVGLLDNTARAYDYWYDTKDTWFPIAHTSAHWASAGNVGPFVLSEDLGKLWLKGQQFGHTSMESSEEWLMFTPSPKWDKHERSLWEASAGFELDEEEKSWLKLLHGSELNFLQQFGFTIYDEDHRIEGRHIVRIMLDDNIARRRARLACLYYNARQSEDQTANDFYTYIQGLEACMKVASMPVQKNARIDFLYSKLRISESLADESGDWEDDFTACNTVAKLIKLADASDAAKDAEEMEEREECANTRKIARTAAPPPPPSTYQEVLTERQEKLANTVEAIASHITDHLFTTEELEWIEHHHGDSGTFMIASNLVPWEKEDAEKARKIVRAAMAADLDEDSTDEQVAGQALQEAMLIDD